MARAVPRHFQKALGASVLLCALALAMITLPTAAAPLVRLDGMGLGWQFLFYLGALPLALLLRSSDEIPTALFLGSVLGMGLLAASGSLLMLFIGLEFMSLPAYLLVARQAAEECRGQEAAVKYFFAGGTAGALFLMGMALYYADTRSLALIGASGPVAQAGLALMGAAGLFKVGAVPLHFWLPDVYEAAAPEVAGFLSTSVKAAGFLLLMRIAALAPRSLFAGALPAAGAVTMLAGSLLALRQRSLQRLLAYSSIAHAGNLILGVGAWAAQGALPAGAAPIFFYLAAYVFLSNGAFAFVRVSGLRYVGELGGFSRREPLLAAFFAVLLLALAGIPPTAGFLAKLLIFWEALKAGLYAPVLAAGLAALIALGYYLGLIRAMYLDEPEASSVPRRGPPAPLPDIILVGACALPPAVLGLAPFVLTWLSGVLSR